MAFESITPAKLLSTTSNHHLPLLVIWCSVFLQVIPSCIFQGHTTADPLGRTPKTCMGADMALEIRSAMVVLDPLAVWTSPVIVLLGSKSCARNGLNVAIRVWSTSYADSIGCSKSEMPGCHEVSWLVSLAILREDEGMYWSSVASLSLLALAWMPHNTEDPIESDSSQPWLLVIVDLMNGTHSMLKRDPIKGSCRTSV